MPQLKEDHDGFPQAEHEDREGQEHHLEADPRHQDRTGERDHREAVVLVEAAQDQEQVGRREEGAPVRLLKLPLIIAASVLLLAAERDGGANDGRTAEAVSAHRPGFEDIFDQGESDCISLRAEDDRVRVLSALAASDRYEFAYELDKSVQARIDAIDSSNKYRLNKARKEVLSDPHIKLWMRQFQADARKHTYCFTSEYKAGVVLERGRFYLPLGIYCGRFAGRDDRYRASAFMRGFTVGGSKAVACSSSAGCHIELKGMPESVKEQIQDDDVRVRWRWTGLPTARTYTVSGIMNLECWGKGSDEFYLVPSPTIDLMKDGEVLWLVKG